jgi:hypothetical protein
MAGHKLPIPGPDRAEIATACSSPSLDQEDRDGPCLSICRDIVEAHHGWFAAGAASGGGTIFRLTLRSLAPGKRLATIASSYRR